jgi:hypothetical protein
LEDISTLAIGIRRAISLLDEAEHLLEVVTFAK